MYRYRKLNDGGQGLGVGKGELVFNLYEVSALQDEKFWSLVAQQCE